MEKIKVKYFYLGDVISVATGCISDFWPNYTNGKIRLYKFMTEHHVSRNVTSSDREQRYLKTKCSQSIVHCYPEFGSEELLIALKDLSKEYHEIEKMFNGKLFRTFKRMRLCMKAERAWQDRLIRGDYGIKFKERLAIRQLRR